MFVFHVARCPRGCVFRKFIMVCIVIHNRKPNLSQRVYLFIKLHFSTFFLVGPKQQCKNMLKPTRAVVSIILISSIAATLLAVFFFKSNLLIIVFSAIQFCALLWYVLSYIPYGRKFCANWLKSCCCCQGLKEERDEPIL